ncbi:MAG: TatD family hydrolase [Candidatus Altiarchaeota archaeon]
MLVDVHCHLDFPQFDGDRDEVVGRANDILIVNSTVDPDSVRKGLDLADKYPNVRCMLGVSASELDGEKFQRMMELITENRKLIVGVGEAGLDYHWVKDEPGKAIEREHFIRVADLSLELGLPLLVHSRDAEADCINILRERKVRAIMHCFSGNLMEAFEAVESGCLISIPANVTHSRGRQELAKSLPIESLVLETDAPYLPPVRGGRSEPSDVRRGCEKIAELRGESFDAVASATTENALKFLKIRT